MLSNLRHQKYIGIILLITAGIGCGKIGDPLPPIPRAPLVVDELAVSQVGTQLVIRFPFVRTQRSRALERIDVYRLVESTGDPTGLPQEEFSRRSTIVTSITVDRIPLNRSVIEYADPLDVQGGPADRRYRYAVRVVTADGVTADFSNYATIVPLFSLALAPAGLRTRQTETEIEIIWDPPAGNEDGSRPANLAGYNIYRRLEGAGETFIGLNPQPITENRYADRNFLFGSKYEYVVHSVSTLPAAAGETGAVESNPSPVLAYSPIDNFPPAAPVSVTIASINGIVSIFWPLNTEPDVAGYLIYRSEDETIPDAQWMKLTPQLHKTASFRDERVQIGKQYFYRITAVDVYGNESARSAAVSEVVAP
ncbi:MAG: fibronectin type III domain-containing protein [Acidobacteriota bacterium]|nr:MAG: fibronectin type III domain-containing protein [Acidobacteriota bacterium]